MPNPLFLAVMKVKLSEYHTYSPAKKARFQKEATERLADLHESDIEGYCKLTVKSARAVADAADQAELDALEDQENN